MSNLPELPDQLAEMAQRQINGALRECYHAGFREGWQAALAHINRLAAAAVSSPAIGEMLPQQVPQRVVFDTTSVVTQSPAQAGPQRQRAPRGSVPNAIDAAYEGVRDGLTYAEIIRRIRFNGNDEIKESSIRNEMRRRLSREEAVEIDGRWYLLPSKQEAPQAEPDGASSDEIREDAFNLVG